MRIRLLRLSWVLFGWFTALSAAAQVASRRRRPVPRCALPTGARVWKGDFDGMLERRHIRVLVPYSRTPFHNDKGRERGITAEGRALSSSSSTRRTRPSWASGR